MRKNNLYLIFLIFLQLLNVSNALAYQDIENKLFVEDKICEIKAFNGDEPDKKGLLILSMNVKKHVSEITYALDFELLNNTDRNLVFHIPSKVIETFKIIIILDENGYKNKGIEQKILQNLKKNWLVWTSANITRPKSLYTGWARETAV